MPQSNRRGPARAQFIVTTEGRVSLYEVLDIPPANAVDAEKLKAARTTQIRMVHPDHASSIADAETRTKASAIVNTAYDTLSDPKMRRKYELTTLAQLFEPCAHCRGTGIVLKQRGFAKKAADRCTNCQGAAYRYRGPK